MTKLNNQIDCAEIGQRKTLPRHIRQAINEIEWSNVDDTGRLVDVSRRTGRSLSRHNLHFDRARELIVDAARKAGFSDDIDTDLFARIGLLDGMEQIKQRTKNHTFDYMRVFC